MIHQKRPAGFTLVELLVVLVIIGLLIALLLPAVQEARESARRTQCANNLKQLSLGCLLHEEAHRSYPCGGWGYKWLGDADRGFGRDQPGGWNYSVLPFIERGDLHDLGAGLSGTARGQAYRQLLTTPVSIFYCPSRRTSGLYEQRSPNPADGQWVYYNSSSLGYIERVVKCDYAMNAGTVNHGKLFDPGPTSIANFSSWKYPGLSTCNGLSWHLSEFGPHDVLDGTSNTLLLGEKGIDPGQLGSWRAGDPQNPYIGHDADNARFCGPGYPLERDRPGSSAYWNFTGPHRGGCLFASCDGSVRTVSWTVSLTVYGQLSNRKDGNPVDY